MLHFGSRCRNALKRNPFGEARLLYAKLLIECTDDELREAVKSGIVEANDELQIRDHIRGLMGNFKTKIIGLITTGDVQPSGIDDTWTKEEFARSFLDHDDVLNHQPSNKQMKVDYEKRIFDKNIVTTVLAKDVEDNRSAIAEALTQRKKTLLKDAKIFMENAVSPFRRRRAGISKFFDSLKGKPTDQAIVVRNRKEFENEANITIYTPLNRLTGLTVLREINANIGKIEEYREKIRPLLAQIPLTSEPNFKSMRDGLEMREFLLNRQQMYLKDTLIKRVEYIDRWQKGDWNEGADPNETPEISPDTFKDHIVGLVDSSEQQEVRKHFQEQIKICNTKNNNTPWGSKNASDRITAANEIANNDCIAVAINEELKKIQGEMNDYMGEIDTLNTGAVCDKCAEYLKEIKEGNAESLQTASGLKAFYASLNIEWTNPMEIYLGWKKYWEVRKQTNDEKERRGAARNAQKFGNMVKAISPFGDFETDVEQTLKAAVDNDDNGVKDGYIKLLKSGPTTFDGLFGAGGEYEKNQHDPLRTKGVLEYAAENGWLYDIDYDKQTVMGVKLIDGKNLPIGEDVEQYLETLSTANGTGSDKARNAGKSSIAYTTSWDPIVKRFKKELKLNNFWGAIGVMEKAIDKGKDAATCTKLATLLIRELRTNKNARKYVTEDMLDQIGNIAFSNVTWAYWALKETDKDGKKKIKLWADEGEIENIEMMGGIGVAIKKAEADIIALEQAAGKGMPSHEKIDELVGNLLAGQIVKEKGWSKSLSIFDAKYKKYRERLEGAEPGKVSGLEDYKEDSEAILLTGVGLKKILRLGSTGAFEHDAFARPYLADIVTKYNQLNILVQLGQIDASVALSFKEHWNNAFERYIDDETQISDKLLSGKFTARKVDPTTGSIQMAREESGIWQTLVQNKLIDIDKLKNKKWSKDKEEFIKKLS